MGTKKLLLTPWHHGRQAAVQAPLCRGKFDEERGKVEEVGGGCWRFLDAEVGRLLFDAEVDILFDAEVDMLLSGGWTDMLSL